MQRRRSIRKSGSRDAYTNAKKESVTTYEVGITYESIAKAVFERIHSEASGITAEVEHFAKVEGVTTRHVVDVLWKFRVGGIAYTTIVQCKNWNTRVKQGDVLAFKAILADIPGQPRGIIVSRSGFQAGARRVAKASGIVLFQLGPAPMHCPRHLVWIVAFTVVGWPVQRPDQMITEP